VKRPVHLLLSEPVEAFPCRIVREGGSGVLSLLKSTEKKGLTKGWRVALDGEHQETLEIRSGKRDIHAPGIAVEREMECQMDVPVKRYVRESRCQSSSSKTSEQEN
jgi:hypothetical protein